MNYLEKLSASELRFRIRQLQRSISAFTASPADEAKLAKLKAALPVAELRDLKRLARHLNYKADIYYPGGRLYARDGKFVVDAAGLGFVNHETGHLTPLELDKLTDGHGQVICIPED